MTQFKMAVNFENYKFILSNVFIMVLMLNLVLFSVKKVSIGSILLVIDKYDEL